MVADRLAVLYLGRIVEIGTSPEVVANPAHPYTRALLEVTGGDDELGDGAVLAGETPSASRVPIGCRFHPRCPRYAERGQPEVCRTQDPVLCGWAGAAQASANTSWPATSPIPNTEEHHDTYPRRRRPTDQ